MLNPDALAKLSQLKQSIEAAKDYAEGVVRGTQGRFGFAMLDDGREAFLPPDTMQQVLPGDRIKVSVVETDKQKLEARLEKLLQSELTEFVGRYMEKGPNHFIVADHPQITRWLFVPPKARKQNAHGDLVRARLTRHPFGDGKAQARVVHRLGKRDEIGIERKYTVTKFNLLTEWPAAVQEQSRELVATALDEKIIEGRDDLRHLPFVTIDAESTQDMDDALYAEQVDDTTWQLMTAIADVGAWVAPDSPLDKAARERATSVYFPGASLPMFPPELSYQHFSLVPGQDRVALVCSITVDNNGDIKSYAFKEALIRSREKLSYQQVSQFLEGNESEAEVNADSHAPLRALAAIARQRRDYRAAQGLLQEERADYYLVLNKQQKIERIERKIPTIAHQVVEEAMLATNACAGEFLAKCKRNGKHGVSALFSTHRGFRRERLSDVKQLVGEVKPELAEGDFEQLAHFVECLRESVANAPPRTLATLRRLMQAGELSYESQPHFGLGFNCYALATSPIRRYQDLHNHRAIKACLREQTAPPADDDLPAQLQQQLNHSRQACRSLEQWLVCEYMAPFAGREFAATISAVSNQGLGVRLADTGIESFIPIRASKENPTRFDSVRMLLTVNGNTYELEQAVAVKLIKADTEKQQLQFEII